MTFVSIQKQTFQHILFKLYYMETEFIQLGKRWNRFVNSFCVRLAIAPPEFDHYWGILRNAVYFCLLLPASYGPHICHHQAKDCPIPNAINPLAGCPVWCRNYPFLATTKQCILDLRAFLQSDSYWVESP